MRRLLIVSKSGLGVESTGLQGHMNEQLAIDKKFVGGYRKAIIVKIYCPLIPINSTFVPLQQKLRVGSSKLRRRIVREADSSTGGICRLPLR